MQKIWKDALVAHFMVAMHALLAKPCHDSRLENQNLKTGPPE